jgi:hypothetical protein
MEEQELRLLLEGLDLKTLKEAAKAQGIKPGRCPTKVSIARMLPEGVLRALVKK